MSPEENTSKYNQPVENTTNVCQDDSFTSEGAACTSVNISENRPINSFYRCHRNVKRINSTCKLNFSTESKKKKLKSSVPKKKGVKKLLEKENQSADSIIVVEDSDHSNSGLEKCSRRSDVIVIDDSSLTDNYFQNILLRKDITVPTKTSVSNAIIIIDPDDEISDVEAHPNGDLSSNKRMRFAEDCEVVWSSVAKSSSTSIPCATESSLVANPLVNVAKAQNVSKRNKISIDDAPHLRNSGVTRSENKIKSQKKKNFKFSSKAIVRKHFSNKICTAAHILNKQTKKHALIMQALTDGSVKCKRKPKKGSLREIVIDGSNIAMAFTHNKEFSEKGIEMVLDYFKKRGHKVRVFVPQHRRSRAFPKLEKWYEEQIVAFTPSRKLGNKRIIPYDDRFIIEYAAACDGIVVSQDQFRDLYSEKPEYRNTIENRLLPPTFVGDYVMFPEDPLGRGGPTLDEFLKY